MVVMWRVSFVFFLHFPCRVIDAIILKHRYHQIYEYICSKKKVIFYLINRQTFLNCSVLLLRLTKSCL